MNLIAITSYFNPFRGKLRRRNYEVFRKHLGIPLLTVEWSQDGNFELSEVDADYLLQISGGDLLWQKERLLNLGLARVRELGISRAALLDCDVVFADREWHLKVNKTLDRYSISQCYKYVNYLPAFDYSRLTREELMSLQPELRLDSLSYGMLQSKSLYRTEKALHAIEALTSLSGNPGMAVALRLDDRPDFRLYEGNLVGGGDIVLMAAFTGRLGELFSVCPYSPHHQSHIRSWQSRNIPIAGKLGYADNQLLHLWHGDMKKRKYRERYTILTENNYDPCCDIDSSHLTSLKLAEKSIRLRELIADYLFSRTDF